MRSLSHHTGTLHIVERMNQSANGNPRFKVTINNVTCCTTPDSSFAYDIQNFDGKQVRAVIGTHYGVQSIHTVYKADVPENVILAYAAEQEQVSPEVKRAMHKLLMARKIGR